MSQAHSFNICADTRVKYLSEVWKQSKPSMSINLHAELETKLRARAEAEGLTVEDYVERLVRDDEQAGDELEALALEGLNSRPPIALGPGYWEEKHRRLNERRS